MCYHRSTNKELVFDSSYTLEQPKKQIPMAFSFTFQFNVHGVG